MNDEEQLREAALRVRERIVRMATGGGCFLGASLSCADILLYLYKRVLKIAPDTLGEPERDYLFLSKGHDVPALYGVLVEVGVLPEERLAHHLSVEDVVYWHPNRAIPGVEFHAGSLGHLLSVGMGVALDVRHRGGPNRVFVLLGDGELNEGSIWEAALVASALGLDSLVAIVDRNGFQANVATEALVPLEPLEAKWRAFGWQTVRVDGHDFTALEGAFAGLPRSPGRPTVVIADTVRGKGIRQLEGRADRWFVRLTDAELPAVLAELRGGAAAEVKGPGLVVR